MIDKSKKKTIPCVDSELDIWLGNLPRMLAYPERLADARKCKASKKNWGINAEQDLLCEAREVGRMINGISTSGLRSLNQLNAAGQLSHSYQSFVDRFKRVKELRVSELCVELLNECGTAKNKILSENDIKILIESTAKFEDVISFEKDQVFLIRKKSKVEITDTRRNDGVLSNGAKIRFQPDLLRTATDNLTLTGRMGVGRIRNPDVRQLNLSDASAAGISYLMSIAKGHTRRLEEIGLQTHEGSDTISLIAAVIMVIGLACISAGSGMIAAGNDDGWWLIGGGIILVVGGAFGGGAELLLETAKSAISKAISPLVV